MYMCHVYLLCMCYEVYEELGVDSPLTHLVPDLSKVHPEDAFSSVPYERGSALLYSIEQIIGGSGKTCIVEISMIIWLCSRLG